MNQEVIADAERTAADLLNIRSFLVMWDGSIVSENYYGGMTAATPQHVRSITKSIVSALVGIAIDKGILRSVNDNVLDYVPELKSQDKDERKRHITIGHLLTMTSGFRWEETGEWFFSDTLSALTDAWSRPLAGNPGEIYNYDSASSDLLTVVLARAANQEAKTFMIENLFAPLDITDFEWEMDPAGYHRGSAGLIMRAPDLAKTGQLYLQKGQWKGQQIVSREWIEQSTAQQVRVNESVSYGYLWRSRQVGSIRHYYGMGHGGQYLMVVPSLNMVVVASHEWQVSHEKANQQKYDFTDRVFDPMLNVWQRLQQPMTLDEYFKGNDESRKLFESLHSMIDSIGAVEIRVTKSQIAFRRRTAFAGAWMPGKYLHGKHAPLVLTVSLHHKDPSPRWKQVVQPYPGRYTHHLELYFAEDIDKEVHDWLLEAWTTAT